MIDKRSKGYFYLAVVLFLLTTLLRVSTPVFFAYIISFSGYVRENILMLCLVYAGIFCVSRFLEEFRLACYVYFEQILQKSLILNTLNKFFSLSFTDARKNTSSESAIIIDRGLGGIRSALYNLIFTLLPLSLECILLLIIIGYKASAFLAVVVFILLSAFVYFTYNFSIIAQKLQQKWFETASSNYKMMSEGIRSFEFLRSFNQTRWMNERYGRANDRFIEEVKISLKPGIILGMIQGGLLFLLFFISTFYTIHTSTDADEMVSLLVLVNGLLLQIAIPLLQFSSSYRFFIQGLSSARQLFNLLALRSVEEKKSHNLNVNVKGFQLDGVMVVYPDGKRITFPDLYIPENEIVIISGDSGVGKSSLAKVLAGLCEYDGCVNTNFKSDDIFYLHQNVDIFDMNFDENIILGKSRDEMKLVSCLNRVGFSEDEIRSMSERSFGEMGTNISGGQAQRVGLARMLYHDAKVMILDEPTTGLDDATVLKIIWAIAESSKGRTAIIVTHDERVKRIGTEHIHLT
nr:ABC transporter ATP-binding protein [Brenneria izadpanahii]